MKKTATTCRTETPAQMAAIARMVRAGSLDWGKPLPPRYWAALAAVEATTTTTTTENA